jgi:hypothetical protein
LLSQTMSSQPSASNTPAAERIAASVPARSRSSLYAGTTMESFRRGAS